MVISVPTGIAVGREVRHGIILAQARAQSELLRPEGEKKREIMGEKKRENGREKERAREREWVKVRDKVSNGCALVFQSLTHGTFLPLFFHFRCDIAVPVWRVW